MNSVYAKGWDEKRADPLGAQANKRLKKKELDSIDVGFVEDLWQRMYLKTHLEEACKKAAITMGTNWTKPDLATALTKEKVPFVISENFNALD